MQAAEIPLLGHIKRTFSPKKIPRNFFPSFSLKNSKKSKTTKNSHFYIEALNKESGRDVKHPLMPLTRMGNKCTPILIRNLERRCFVKTDVNANEGRPFGLYGNSFSRGKPETIKNATVVINPPQIVNLIAMAALAGNLFFLIFLIFWKFFWNFLNYYLFNFLFILFIYFYFLFFFSLF